MPYLPAAKFIPEYGATDPDGDGYTPGAGAAFKEPSFTSVSARSVKNPDDAYLRGYEAGKSAALAEFEDRLEKERDQHIRQLELERFTWANRETELLAGQIGDGLKDVEVRLANTVARVLRPFLSETIQSHAIAELLSALEMLLGADEGITLEISGPEDLLQLLREKLNGRNVTVLFTPASGTEVRVVAGQTILETVLGQWMRRVEERVE